MKKTNNTGYSLDSLLDIISNLLGIMILILIVITLISFSNSFFIGNVEKEYRDTNVIVDKIDESAILPKWAKSSPHQAAYSIMLKNNKVYFFDFAEFYKKMYEDFSYNKYERSFNVGDFNYKLNFDPMENPTTAWNVSYAAINSKGLNCYNKKKKEVEINEKELIKYLKLKDESNPEGFISPKYHYFYINVYEDSFVLYQKINNFLLDKGFSTGVETIPANWNYMVFIKSIFFGDLRFYVQYQKNYLYEIGIDRSKYYDDDDEDDE